MERIVLEFRVFAGLFSVIIVLLGAVSLYQLAEAYNADEQINNEWSSETASKLESDYSASFAFKMDFVGLNGGIRSILRQPEMNQVVKLNNGHLTSILNKTEEDIVCGEAAELQRVQEIVTSFGAQFLYVQAPYSVSKYDSQLPIGYEDAGNADIDELLQELTNREVTFLDLREEMHVAGVNQYDLWYRTDHHWTTEGGFWAFQTIAKYLISEEEYQIPVSVLDEAMYEKKLYPHWHLGSFGQRVGALYAGVDDFILYLPRFQTEFDDMHASFVEVMYNMKPLQERDYASRYTYDTVLRPVHYNHKNHLAGNDIKCLVVCDSMGSAVLPFFGVAFSETHFVDPWVLTREMLYEYQPDVVIVLYHPMRISSGANDFYKFEALF